MFTGRSPFEIEGQKLLKILDAKNITREVFNRHGHWVEAVILDVAPFIEKAEALLDEDCFEPSWLKRASDLYFCYMTSVWAASR